MRILTYCFLKRLFEIELTVINQICDKWLFWCSFFDIEFFVFDEELDEVLVVHHLLFFDGHDHLDLFLEFLQVVNEFPAVLNEIIYPIVILFQLVVCCCLYMWIRFVF